MKLQPLNKKTTDQIEKRAARAMKTMGEICVLAGVAHSTWSRAKARGRIRTQTLDLISGAVDEASQTPGPDAA